VTGIETGIGNNAMGYVYWMWLLQHDSIGMPVLDIGSAHRCISLFAGNGSGRHMQANQRRQKEEKVIYDRQTLRGALSMQEMCTLHSASFLGGFT
jgi:hypothetical protein